MRATPSEAQPRLRLEHVSKTFGRYRALSDVSFDVSKGELHGIVGQNGSGKSTLAKILTGYHAPDSGSVVTVDGAVLDLPVRPADLDRCGVAVVHQSLGLLDDLTVIENLRLGHFGARRFSRRIDWSVERNAVVGVLERLECDVNLNALVGTLSAEQKATLAIARAIQSHEPGKGLIIFDESTKALNRDALTRFYALVRGVIDDGASVLLICHRLEEVLEHTDRVTVLRDGKLAATGLVTKDLTEAELTRTMLGYSLTAHTSRSAGRSARTSPAGDGVTVRGLTGPELQPLDLDIKAGEILGITGLVGSGFGSIAYMLSGAWPAQGGRLTVRGREIALTELSAQAPRRLLEAGVSLVPRDRDEVGLMYDESISVNITLPRVRTRSHALRVDRAWERAEVSATIERLGISPPEPEMLISQLSGGNQQKVLLGKWLAGEPALLLLHEPTQAVDVGARRDILRALEDAADRGTSIIVASTYADELAMVCDRVLVFHEGEVVAELGAGASEDEILEATFRTHKDRALAGA
jgi:ribose transport system ATP-binding protein